jgi:hypothetical protein
MEVTTAMRLHFYDKSVRYGKAQLPTDAKKLITKYSHSLSGE